MNDSLFSSVISCARRDAATCRLLALIAAHAGLIVFLWLGSLPELPQLGALYLPLHSLIEVFAVVVAMMIFSIGWHGFNQQNPRSVVVLSSAFFSVGLLDFGHLMSVPGMPLFFTPSSVSKGIDFWLAARAVGAAALLAVALLPWTQCAARRARTVTLTLSGMLAALVYGVVLGRPDLIPETFVAGRGLTSFKVGSEYLLVMLNFLAAALLLRRALVKPTRSTRCLAAAAAIMGLSEICFTLYARADDAFNFVGHLYKVIAYLYLYRAIFVAGVREPYRRLRHSERSMAAQLRCDALTGLPNRLGITELLGAAQAEAQAGPHMLALHFFDLDFFKKINHTFGHTDGDAVLRECVARLAAVLPAGATLGRQGGDAFVVLQRAPDERARVAQLAEALLQCMREPFFIQGHEVFLSASLGIALFPEDGPGEGGLLQQAHVAMNSAKQDCRNGYRFHTPDMAHGIRARLDMESQLRHAVERNELLLHYQPRVCVASGAMLGVEALVRWQHPTLGLVPPVRFIPIAEESGLIESVGMWVLREACSQARRWQAQGLAPLCVSVNLSARQFQQAGLAQQIGAVLAETGLDARYLELEITEGTVMHDTQAAVSVLHALKQLGVTLSIDDFGTGYSSLSYLKLFPIDVLKIDRSFVTDVISDPNDAAITRAIIALAHVLELDVVAEGVETLEQARFLTAAGCDQLQGYYLSRPVAPEPLAALLREGRMAALARGWSGPGLAVAAESVH